MATAKSILFLLLSILLLIKIHNHITPLSQRYYNFPSPDQVYTKVVLNLAFLKSNDNVFPAIGSYSHRSANRKTLPMPLPPPPPPPQILINDENDMIPLTEKNFINFIESNRRVMVIFYTSEWRVAPEHATTCMQLTGACVVAKVDFNEEKTLVEKYKIVRYPSVYFFPGGADLGDKYYSEVFLEGEAGEHVRGEFFGRSDEYVEKDEKNDKKSMVIEDSKHFIGIFDPRKNKKVSENFVSESENMIENDSMAESEERVEGHFRGEFFGRSDGDVGEDEKNEEKSTVKIDSKQFIGIVDPRKNKHIWQNPVLREDVHYEVLESYEVDPKTDQMPELNILTTEAVEGRQETVPPIQNMIIN